MIYNIGTLIKSRREELKISQEDLCAGICSVSTLSRIENGHGVSTQSHATMLLQRLGYYDTTAFVFQSGEEIEMHNLQHKIGNHISVKRLSEARMHLADLEKYKPHFDAMDKLYFELMKELLDISSKNNSPQSKLNSFERIIKITHPEYRRDNLPKMMTHIEAMTVNNIAIYLSLSEQYDDALNVFMYLIDYYKSRVTDFELAKKFLPLVYYNTSKTFGMLGEYDKCIRMCDEAMEYCRFVQKYSEMPNLMYNKAWCMVRRKNPGDMETANKLAKEAYIMATVMENRLKLPELLSELLKDYFDEAPPEF